RARTARGERAARARPGPRSHGPGTSLSHGHGARRASAAAPRAAAVGGQSAEGGAAAGDQSQYPPEAAARARAPAPGAEPQWIRARLGRPASGCRGESAVHFGLVRTRLPPPLHALVVAGLSLLALGCAGVGQ